MIVIYRIVSSLKFIIPWTNMFSSISGDSEVKFGDLWMQNPTKSKKYDYQTGLYVCKVCGKSFRRPNSCYDHMAIHQGTSKCVICNCVLSRKGNMKRHMKIVHGVSL